MDKVIMRRKRVCDAAAVDHLESRRCRSRQGPRASRQARVADLRTESDEVATRLPGPSLTGGRSDDAQLDVHFLGSYVGHLDNETDSHLLELLDAVSLSGTDTLHVDHPLIALADRGRDVVGHPSSQVGPRQK